MGSRQSGHCGHHSELQTEQAEALTRQKTRIRGVFDDKIRVMRKPNNVIVEQVRHKPSCTSTEDGLEAGNFILRK